MNDKQTVETRTKDCLDYIRTVCSAERPILSAIGRDGHLNGIGSMVRGLEEIALENEVALAEYEKVILEQGNAMRNLLKYFVSANSVEVERATILTSSKEIQELRRLVCKVD
jgi:hypothetical protein